MSIVSTNQHHLPFCVRLLQEKRTEETEKAATAGPSMEEKAS